MNNADVAAALLEIAELLELKNESSFRIRAYEKAAAALDTTTEDVRVLTEQGRLTEVKGIGQGIATKIQELTSAGHLEYLEELRTEFPAGVRTLMAVPGVGPSLARRVYQELGVETIDALKEAAEDGRLASLPGLGDKSAKNVLAALGRVSKRESRISLGKAEPVVEELIEDLLPLGLFHDLTPAGSLRRWVPTIGDIDLMATASDPKPAMEAFVGQPQVARVLGQGPTKSSILTDNGLQIDLRILEEESFGSLLQHFTGSRAHNIELREYALGLGLSLSEYGITRVDTSEGQKYREEEPLYAALGLDYIPPELREGSGEIQAAKEKRLPSLVTTEDIRGDLHVHTDWSDGSASIERMVEAARERGYQYVAITDHSSGAGMTGGPNAHRLLEQVGEIRKLDRKMQGIRVLAGCEVDIKRDGSLDFPDEVLAQLDWVVASVHAGFNQTEAEITGRIMRAIENPHVHAIGHPTGRLIGKRVPYALDLESIFKAAAKKHTALEINSFPDRLDLTDTHVRRARELGCKLVIDTDAHAPIHFEKIRYGVAMARRGWCESKDILNTLSASRLESWLKRGARWL